MITTNSALYMGIVSACVLDRCPDATIHIERAPGGYHIDAMRKVGAGADARSFVSRHAFLDAETSAVSSQALTDAARIAGNGLGAILLSA